MRTGFGFPKASVYLEKGIRAGLSVDTITLSILRLVHASRDRPNHAHCKQPPLRYCRNWAVRGKTRCKFHGGMSTGPRTPEGKARVVAAMVEGRRRWAEK